MTNETLGGINRFTNVTLNNLTVRGSETIAGNLAVTGTLTAGGGVIGNVAVAAGVVGTPDNGTTQTLTAAMVTGSAVFTSHTSTGGSTPSLTMPLATDIIAAYSGWAIGDSYTLRIINLNSGTATVVTNTGITLTGTATIPTGGQADFIITMTGAATVSMVRVDAVSTVTVDAVQALTGKTINGLTVTTSTGTLTVPNGVTLTGPAASGTAATLAGTETLTNKTLTAPVIGAATGTSVSVTGGYTALSGTAVPASAGALAAGAPFTAFSGGNKIWWTSDTPAFSATKGDLAINTGGSSSSTRLFINDGTTNWIAITTAS